jgi:antitoxin component YwqK of YwqJK toxin-antitoxin module
MRHGTYKKNYSADIPRWRGEFFFGQRNGIWKWWYENGQLRKEIDYDRGILLSIKCWDENGKREGCDSNDIPPNKFIRPAEYEYRRRLPEAL